MEKSKKILIWSVGVIASVFFCYPNSSFAASLNFSPTSITKTVGESFSLMLFVASSDQVLNAVSATVSFPIDKLEVTQVTKEKTIANVWAVEPIVSNTNGTIHFESVILNPGFMGSQGDLLTVWFKTKVPGKALVNFVSGLVLANDGKGTNILTSLGSANISILNRATKNTPPVQPISEKIAPSVSPEEKVETIVVPQETVETTKPVEQPKTETTTNSPVSISPQTSTIKTLNQKSTMKRDVILLSGLILLLPFLVFLLWREHNKNKSM